MHQGWMNMGWMGILWWVLIAVVVVVVILALRRGGATGGASSPEDVLKHRYARGEIDREQYERMLEDLRR